MTKEQEPIPARFRRFLVRTNINVSQSDIRPIVRAELRNLQRDVRNAVGRSSDRMTRYHLQDVIERISLVLDPKK